MSTYFLLNTNRKQNFRIENTSLNSQNEKTSRRYDCHTPNERVKSSRTCWCNMLIGVYVCM